MWGVVAMIVSAVSAGASMYAQAEQIEAQNEAQKNQAEQRFLQLQEQQAQENDRAAIDSFEVKREALRKKALAKTQGAESGALGNSFSRIMAEADIDEIIDLSYVEKSRENAAANTSLGLDATQIKAESSFGEQSGVLAGLQIGVAGASGYMSGRKMSGEGE